MYISTHFRGEWRKGAQRYFRRKLGIVICDLVKVVRHLLANKSRKTSLRDSYYDVLRR